ncbi:ABC transporter permease [Chryseolinea sp. H1M3-3]|uniref:ABC transporter permease n=1 Tax=Chryseolinea sp. H1M3-3 TaxID=3034144 RepID=UPI0023ECEA72|nr:ABC transporter permease [Chryseolinea sp. H1M3-3]
MIKNYLTSVLRYILRNKGFTFINVLGLAIGMMACMLITQYVLHEFSYDDFHEKKARIFRMQQDRYENGVLATRWAAGCAGIGPDMKANFPEVERFVRLSGTRPMFSVGDVYFKETDVYYASEDFFKIFSVKLLAGEDSSVLREPFKIVLSQSLAKKYFGQEDPVGKMMRVNGKEEYQVTGIFEDLPANTHMQISALMSFVTLTTVRNDPMLTWSWDGFLTYVLLHEKADVKAIEAKIPALAEQKTGEEMKRFNAGIAFHMQPVTDIHLDSNFMMEFKPNGNRQSTYFLSIVAILILVIAWINYINLSTAKSIERAREVGVRKVMGSIRSQLIQQFLVESLLLNIVAVIISVVLVVMLTPAFSDLTGRQLDYLLFKQNMFWIWMGALIIGGALLSGLYPAFVLSSYKPVEVLKGRFKNTHSGVRFRKGMVIVQFICSITLIVGTFTVYRQIQFMQNQALGVNIDQTLILPSPNVVDSTYETKFQVFKQQIHQYPEVVAVTASSEVPGRQPGWNAGGIRRLSQSEKEAKQYRVIMMDHDFIPLYGLKVIAGRGFSGETANEWKNVLLNESAFQLMGFKKPEDALNDQIFFWGDTFRIVGVVKNYHQESLKKAFEPLVLRYNASPGGLYSIKFNTSNVKESLSRFEDTWKAIFAGNPFSYFFLDDHYNQQYQADQQFGKVFGIFSTLAIFIACLGLFGLSSLTAIQRTKEIGIRKVLGASVPSILTLVSKDYLILMLIAITLSVPVAWWIMNEWLSEFAYRISLAWWIFGIPSFVVVAIALLTVSIHTINAARINPARSLRYE